MLRQVRGSLKELTAPQLAGCGSGTKNILWTTITLIEV
jgi:hypothetical protein